MPNIANYVGGDDRAADAWKRIQEKPTSIVIKRSNATLTAQTIRLEVSNTVSERQGQSEAVTSVQQAVVFGVRGHSDPAILDTNIQRGDRFDANGQKYRVLSVIFQRGEVQAVCEMTS